MIYKFKVKMLRGGNPVEYLITVKKDASIKITIANAYQLLWRNINNDQKKYYQKMGYYYEEYPTETEKLDKIEVLNIEPIEPTRPKVFKVGIY